jgi:hypothetical protein
LQAAFESTGITSFTNDGTSAATRQQADFRRKQRDGRKRGVTLLMMGLQK